VLKSFRGGVHPEESKKYTMNKCIEKMPVPQKVIIPVSQHIGAPGTPIVKIGDMVKKDSLLLRMMLLLPVQYMHRFQAK